MSDIRVLIVDDQHLFAEGLRHVIEGETRGDIEVAGIAENGEVAAEMVDQLDPDVILMDVRMPVMDGVVATRTICEKHPGAKIMMLTTFDDDELVFDALGAGAHGYVLKNVEPKDIVRAIEALHTGAFYFSPTVGFKLRDAKDSERQTEDNSAVAAILSKFPVLTMREAEVLEQVLRARKNDEIAQQLFVSEKTIRNHISMIYEKLGIHNRLKLINHLRDLIIGEEQPPR